jgi:hypothetical protein
MNSKNLIRKNANNEKLELEDIVLIGRTFDEYYRMFELNKVSKNNKILDVAAGVSSFCAEANNKNYNVTASDRIYNYSSSVIEDKCINDLELVMKKVMDIKKFYKWNYFKNIDALKKTRRKAYQTFITDFKVKNNNRYVPMEFPEIKLKDNQFTISLASHFLFLYDEFLDYEFHKNTIIELIRITTDEIRLFPLINLNYKKYMFA